MKIDIAYGIMPLHLVGKCWEVLLVKHNAGHWGLPKGHPNPGELPKECAERELFEETGLTVQRYLSEVALSEHYYFNWQGKLIHKKVEYFLAYIAGDLNLQASEIQDSQWIDLQKAPTLMSFSEGKKMCLQATQLLTNVTHNLHK